MTVPGGFAWLPCGHVRAPKVDGASVRRLRVRRALGAVDDWVEVVAPLEESIDPSGAMPLDGIGLLDWSRLVDGHIVLWRLPASLTS